MLHEFIIKYNKTIKLCTLMSAADKHDAIVNINLAALHKKLNVLCTCKYFLKSDTCTEVIRYC